MQRAVHFLAVTCLIASLAVLLVFAVPSRTAWGEPPGDAKATGSLTVKIKPRAAKQEGARWRVDGGGWKKSGRTVTGVAVGQHMVSFKDVFGWTSPADKQVDIVAGQRKSLSGKYKQASSLTIMLPGDVPLDFVWIPAGSFMMGRSAEDELDSGSDESPQHQVTFANGFWMGKYEVTQAQWVAVMGSNPSNFTGDVSLPVEGVSWTTIQPFIAAVNALGQGTVHLPTEAQWEYACRAGTTTRFYWGDDLSLTEIGSYAWYYDNSSSTTHPVGLMTANLFGLFDMSGNVWEWCEDWYHSTYIGAPTDGSAWVSGSSIYRVVRGASWSYGGGSCRSADRYQVSSSGTNHDIGFRLAR